VDFRLAEKIIAARFQLRDRENPDEIVDFLPNPAQHRLLAMCQRLFDEKRSMRIISVKSRRIGFSRIVEAVACCFMFAYANFEGRVMAHYDETAMDLMSSAALMVYGDGEAGKGIPQRSRRVIWEPDQDYKYVVVPHSGRKGSAASRLLRASAKVKGKGRGLGFSFFHGCLSADSEIVTENGDMVPIAEIKPGMTVLTCSGAFAKVKHLIPQDGEHPTMRIRTWLNGDTLTVTAHHKILTARGWIPAGELMLSDEIGVPIPHRQVRIVQLGADPYARTMLNLASARQPKKGKRLREGLIHLDREFGFFVGHYLAEGWIANQAKLKYGPSLPAQIGLACHIDERAFADRSIRAISAFCTSAKVKEDRAHNRLLVTIYGGSLAQIVGREFGHKDEKRIPDWIFDAPVEFRIGVLLGYAAGDGSKKVDRTAGYENAAISITSIRKRLLVQYRRILASVGWGYAGLHQKTDKPDPRGWNCQKAYLLRINGSAAARIRQEFDGIVERADFAGRSERKALKATKYRLDEGIVWLKIRALEEDKIQPVYDIEVDHPDHSFDTSIGVVANSEAAYYPADSPFSAILPTLAKSKTRSFGAIESTGNGQVGDGEAFYKYWQQASDIDKPGDSDWVRFFVPWTEDPHAVSNQIPTDCGMKDDEEKALLKSGLTKYQIAWRRHEIATTYQGIVEEFNVENPLEPNDAFRSSGFPAFAYEEQQYATSSVREPLLTAELERTRDPWVVKLSPMGIRGRIKIWELPQPRMEYYIGVDLCRGEDETERPGDFAAIVVINGSTGEQAAAFTERMDPSKMADLVDKLGRFYRTPQISPSHCALLNIEVNANLGAECQRLLRDRYAYPAWRFARWRGSKDDRYNRKVGTAIGWETTGASRKLMFAAFRNSLREKAVCVRDSAWASQICAATMDDGRFEVTIGHDDVLLAGLMAWIARQQFPPQTFAARKDIPEVARPYAEFDIAGFPMIEELSRSEAKEHEELLKKKKRQLDPLQGVLGESTLG
jgi:intein/homing endonuclease